MPSTELVTVEVTDDSLPHHCAECGVECGSFIYCPKCADRIWNGHLPMRVCGDCSERTQKRAMNWCESCDAEVSVEHVCPDCGCGTHKRVCPVCTVAVRPLSICARCGDTPIRKAVTECQQCGGPLSEV